MRHLYYRFIRFSLGLSDGGGLVDGSAVRDIDWASFFAFAKKQTLTGILMDGIQKLPKDAAPPRSLLMTWFGLSQGIARRNTVLNIATAGIYRKIREVGFMCCILKGQGNAVLYPNPSARIPGDVDVWIDAGRDDIRRLAGMLAGSNGKVLEESISHIGLNVGGVTVELHSLPAFMANAVYSRRLKAWMLQNIAGQCSNMVALPDGVGEVAVPTAAFNAVYQLYHLYHHYFYEGVGLRQVVDYYFVLTHALSDAAAKAGLRHCLARLGLRKFAGAVMYVLHVVLGLPADMMLVPIDARRGSLLLGDIIKGGNFGKYAMDGRQGGAVMHNVRRLQRDVRLLRYYPEEALAEPLFRLWHFFWRKTVCRQ